MGQKPTRIIQISDTHIFADDQGELLGVPTRDSFQTVVNLVESYIKENPIDLIVHTGDMSQDYSADSYERLAKMISVFDVPVYCVPGNHDDYNVMTSVFPLGQVSNDKHIIVGNWQLILLNSQIPGKVEGFLDESQLQFMQDCLQKNPDHHAIVFFHHQPLRVGSEWLDNIWLTNADKFWDTVCQYPQVKSVLFGHVHQQFEQAHNGITCYSTPSTCIQFMRKKDDFGIEKLPPAFRWVELDDQGKLATGVVRAPEYVGYFDKDAKGY